MTDTEGLMCLMVAPSATKASQRQSEAFFNFALRAPLGEAGVDVRWARKLVAPAQTSETPIEEVERADFVLAEVSLNDPIVFLYLGLVMALGKTLVTLQRSGTESSGVPGRIADFHVDYEMTSFGVRDLSLRIREILGHIVRVRRRRLDQRSAPSLDWDHLDTGRLVELMHELLLLRGASSVRPVRGASALQLIAKFPARDRPDGRIVALVSVDPGLPAAAWTQLWWTEVSRALPKAVSATGAPGSGHTLRSVFVSPSEVGPWDADTATSAGERLQAMLPEGWRLESESWNRERLERAVAAQPTLIAKYLARTSASERGPRTTGDLYREAVAGSLRLLEAHPATALQPESEPPSMWKDLAFTATHSIGNSLFPVEVYLDHILEAARRDGHRDSEEAAERALENLEKAKLQVERFKSFATDRKPTLEAVDVERHLRVCLEYARSSGAEVELFSDKKYRVWADPLLLDECLDELVANALTWLEGASRRRISVAVRIAGPDDLPSSLAPGPNGHLWLRFEDSGPGIPREDKERIFDLFFSRHPQGKGIGLSSIRRSVRRMAGEIVETGLPGRGACFELFLPVAPREYLEEPLR